MYHYADLVDYLLSLDAKTSASKLNNVFFSLVTEHEPCQWFVEAGAFEASASMLIKSRLPDCQVHAFEANIDNYNHFKPLVSDIEYHYTAMSDHTGTIIFKQQSHTSTGMTFPKVRGNNSTKTRTLDHHTIYNDIEVPCTTFNDFFAGKIKSSDTMGIWLDLEGTAYEALTAATDILSNISFIKVEVEDKQYWEKQKLSQDIVDFMSTHGLVPIIRDHEMITVKQYNILFANKRLVNDQLYYFIKKTLDQ